MWTYLCLILDTSIEQASVAQLDASSTGDQEVVGSTFAGSARIFR